MKKLISGFIIIVVLMMSVMIVSGCGVKSDLARPNPEYPRDYPVY